MAKARLRFTENEVARAVRAVRKTGVQIARVLVCPSSGNITVIAAGDGDTSPPRKKVDRRLPKQEAMP
jgi:hypothetical protein